MTNLSKTVHLVNYQNQKCIEVRFRFIPLYCRISVDDIQRYLENEHIEMGNLFDASEIMDKIHDGAMADEFCLMVAEFKDDWQNLDYSEVQNFIYELQKKFNDAMNELVEYRKAFSLIHNQINGVSENESIKSLINKISQNVLKKSA
jgi:hypothetical protein